MKCKICGVEHNKLYNGLCTSCMSVEAVREELASLEEDNILPSIEINQPLGDNFLNAFRVKQSYTADQIPSDKQLQVKLHCTDLDWEAIKPIVDRAIEKYRDKLATGEYEIMEMNQFGLDGINRILIENNKGVAVVKRDLD